MASSESLFQDSNDRIEFSELLHVHAGLRWELTLLYEKSLLLVKSIGTGGSKELQWKNNLSTFLKQFDFFFVIFHSHSKAEDDIIMPALTNRAAISMGKIPEELSHEHDGHHQFFDNIRLHLLPLRNEGAMNLSGEKSEGLRSLVEHVALLIEKLRSVVMLHFRKEEEELLPLLVTHFTKEELIELVGKIIGERSGELMQQFIAVLSRGLPPNDRDKAIGQIKEAAKGTLFSRWLEVAPSGESKENSMGMEIETPKGTSTGAGAVRSFDFDRGPHTFPDSEQVTSLGCKHYRRKCKILSPCCNQFFGCRLCHDEYFENSMDNMHSIDRYLIKTVKCMVCQTEQPVSKNCMSCNTRFAKYVCTVCRLYDDNVDHRIYHCPFCNVCRTGRNLGDDFFHCMKCNACINTKHRNHRCMEHSLESNCPICFSDMFSSTKPIKELNCGHFMHRECFDNFSKNDFKCPVCRKAIIDMSEHWRHYEGLVANYRSSLAMQRRYPTVEKRMIHCNECSTDGEAQRVVIEELPYAIPFKCTKCKTYNTVVL
mmetsp:Transcript_10790/g.14059  ORF Transcript_10790/g.14059 Transcript_10790/m.14059 type:complete len:540 (+) Transcript_10790:274-1893(+)